MKYNVEINGINVNANYTDENIQNIFLPLLKKMTIMSQEKGSRILVLLAAPPGAGKSTLCAFLQYLSETTDGVEPIQVIGMDGFHRYQDYLLSHVTVRDGEEISMVKIKGAPETFNLDSLIERVERVSKGEICGWPTYNRMTHNPQEDAITVDGNIVLLEGNYLLLNQPGWRDIKNFADLSIGILADEDDLRKRLVDRKIKSGTSTEEAVRFVEYSDLYNARTVLNQSMKGDISLMLLNDDSYEEISDSFLGKEQ